MIDSEGQDRYINSRFFGKFKEPWNAAVKKNNEEVKGRKP